MFVEAAVAEPPELLADPLGGAVGYRLRSAVVAGACEGEKGDGCPSNYTPGLCRSTGGRIRCSCKPCASSNT